MPCASVPVKAPFAVPIIGPGKQGVKVPESGMPPVELLANALISEAPDSDPAQLLPFQKRSDRTGLSFDCQSSHLQLDYSKFPLLR